MNPFSQLQALDFGILWFGRREESHMVHKRVVPSFFLCSCLSLKDDGVNIVELSRTFLLKLLMQRQMKYSTKNIEGQVTPSCTIEI